MQISSKKIARQRDTDGEMGESDRARRGHGFLNEFSRANTIPKHQF